MNLEHYRNFVAVVEAGNISAASRKLCIAQPALSNQIKAFEAEYGAQLLKRGARRVELTDAGRIFYDKARNICRLEDAAQKEISACVVGSRGTLRLALTPANPDPFINNLLLDFHEAYPDIQFEIYEVSSDDIIELLMNGIVEVGVVRTPVYIPSVLRVSLAIAERLMAVYRRDNPWLSPDLEKVPISALKGLPLSVSRGFRNKINDACAEAGFVPNLISVCSSRALALMWSSRGGVVSIIVGADAKTQDNAEFCCRAIDGPNMSTQRSFAVLRERELSAVAQSFLNFADKFKDHFLPFNTQKGRIAREN